jgi:8-oxo-dGTP pyrophosphatase MutT (NUDIX family)
VAPVQHKPLCVQGAAVRYDAHVTPFPEGRFSRPEPAHPGQQRGPWRVVGSREVYRNAWLRLRHDTVLRPDGSPGIYGVVELEPAVGIVAVDDRERVWLVGQYRYPTQRYSWEIISGFAQPGEEPLAAARRELREEAGLTAQQWDYLGDFDVSNSVTDQVGFVFLARGLSPCPADPELTEELSLRQLPLEEALREAAQGSIVQAVSVAALFRAWHHLRLSPAD